MGRRERQDPAGHQQRAKGAPTDPAPQNAPPPPPEQQAAPGPSIAFFPEHCEASIGEHPMVTGPILDLRFGLPGNGSATMRMPAGAWEGINALVEAALGAFSEEAERAAKAGIHLPDGVDVDAEARAQSEMVYGSRFTPNPPRRPNP